jgi:hypothetical protein
MMPQDVHAMRGPKASTSSVIGIGIDVEARRMAAVRACHVEPVHAEAAHTKFAGFPVVQKFSLSKRVPKPAMMAMATFPILRAFMILILHNSVIDFMRWPIIDYCQPAPGSLRPASAVDTRCGA